jgi:hypothetical protein
MTALPAHQSEIHEVEQRLVYRGSDWEKSLMRVACDI